MAHARRLPHPSRWFAAGGHSHGANSGLLAGITVGRYPLLDQEYSVTPEGFKAWRKAVGWTQKEAAEALGISKNAVASYDSGSVEIPKSVAFACLEHLRAANDRELEKVIQQLGTPSEVLARK